MPQCAVNSCRNSHRKTRGKNVHYHRFPPDKRIRALWVEACDRQAPPGKDMPFNIATARICSRHFPKSSYEISVNEDGTKTYNTRLRRGIVPTAKLTASSEEEDDDDEDQEMKEEKEEKEEAMSTSRELVSEPSRDHAEEDVGDEARSEQQGQRKQQGEQERQGDRKQENSQAQSSRDSLYAETKIHFMKMLGLESR